MSVISLKLQGWRETGSGLSTAAGHFTFTHCHHHHHDGHDDDDDDDDDNYFIYRVFFTLGLPLRGQKS